MRDSLSTLYRNGGGVRAGRSYRSKVRVTEYSIRARAHIADGGADHLADMVPYRDDSQRVVGRGARLPFLEKINEKVTNWLIVDTTLIVRLMIFSALVFQFSDGQLPSIKSSFIFYIPCNIIGSLIQDQFCGHSLNFFKLPYFLDLRKSRKVSKLSRRKRMSFCKDLT